MLCQYATVISIQSRRNRDVFDLPALVLAKRFQKSCDMTLEIVNVGNQLARRSLAGSETQPTLGFVDCNEINFRIAFVPVSKNAIGKRKVSRP